MLKWLFGKEERDPLPHGCKYLDEMSPEELRVHEETRKRSIKESDKVGEYIRNEVHVGDVVGLSTIDGDELESGVYSKKLSSSGVCELKLIDNNKILYKPRKEISPTTWSLLKPEEDYFISVHITEIHKIK